jgi:hypothetical protein
MTTLQTTQQLNQFSMTLSRGFVVEDGGVKSVSGILANANVSQVTSCGDLVKLVADSAGSYGQNIRVFAEVTATDTGGYGFVKKNLKQTQYSSGDQITVARNFDVIVGLANYAINIGDNLVYLQATGKIDTAAHAEPDEGVIACGVAVSKAAAGDLVKFEIHL